MTQTITAKYRLYVDDPTPLIRLSETIPNGVTKIENTTFEDCAGLTSVTLPSSLEKLGNFGGVSPLSNIPMSK